MQLIDSLKSTNPWGASASLQALAAIARTKPGLPDQWSTEQNIALIQADIEGLDATMTYLMLHLDEEQLQDFITGNEFRIGRLALRACVFSASGTSIHLQLRTEDAMRWDLSAKKLSCTEEVFCDETMCGRNGGRLQLLDAPMLELLATTDACIGHRALRRPRRAEKELLELVCRSCIEHAHRMGLQQLCPHGGVSPECSGCAFDYLQALAAERRACQATVKKIHAITGPGSFTVTTLRKLGHHSAVSTVIKEHVKHGNVYKLAVELGWNTNTVLSLAE